MFFAKVRLYDPQGYTPDGLMFVTAEALAWHEVSYLEPEQCDHQETMCRQCRHTWEYDYEVEPPVLV